MKKRQKTTENKHPTNTDVQRIEKEIRQLRNEDKTDNEIRQKLRPELRTYQRYIKKLNDEDREVWYELTKNELATELVSLRDSLIEDYRYCKQKLEDPKVKGSEKLVWFQEKQETKTNLVRLLMDGPNA